MDNLADRREDLEDSLAERKAEFQEDLEDWKENLVQRKAELQAQKDQRRAARKADLAELRDKLQDLMDGEAFGQRRLMAAFPKMRSTDHTQALERLRRRMELRRDESKKRH